MEQHARTLTSVTVEAKVIGPDGEVKQDLGTVAYWHRNPIRRLLGRLRVRGSATPRGGR